MTEEELKVLLSVEDNISDVIDDLLRSLGKAGKKFEDLDDRELAELIEEFFKLQKAEKGAEKSADSLNNSLENMPLNLAAALDIAQTFADIAGGFKDAFQGFVVTPALEEGQLLSQLESMGGKVKEQAGEILDISKNIFNDASNAATLEETTGIVRKAAQHLETDIQSVSDTALRLNKVYQADSEKVIFSVQQLTTKLGLSSKEATDFIASGFANGLDASGDFLDSILEYSVQFESLGASAEEFYSILSSGQVVGGNIGVDKFPDLIKEFRLRTADALTDASKEAYKKIGLDAEDFINDLNSGAVSGLESVQHIIDKLNNVESDTVRLSVAAELLGTPFEDLGDITALSLDITKTKMKDLAGATDTLKNSNLNAGDQIEAAWRSLQSAVIDSGVSDAVNSVVSVIAKLIKQFAGFLKENPKISAALAGIAAGVVALAGALAAGVAITTAASAAMGILTPMLAGVASAAAAAAVPLAALAVAAASAYAVKEAYTAYSTASDMATNAGERYKQTLQAVAQEQQKFKATAAAVQAGNGDANDLVSLRESLISRLSQLEAIYAELSALDEASIFGIGTGVDNAELDKTKQQIKDLKAELKNVNLNITNQGGFEEINKQAAAIRKLKGIESSSNNERAAMSLELRQKKLADIQAVLDKNKTALNKSEAQERAYVQKVKGLRRSLAAEQQDQESRLRALQQAGMSAHQRELDKQKQALETLGKARIAANSGDSEETQELAKQAQTLAESLGDNKVAIAIFKQASQVLNESKKEEIATAEKAAEKQKEQTASLKESINTLSGEAKKLQIDVNTSVATKNINELQTLIDSMTDKTVNIKAQTQYVEARQAGGLVGFSFAAAKSILSGGKLGGYGGGDKVPLLAEAGEFVVKKERARVFHELLNMLNYAPLGAVNNMLSSVVQRRQDGGAVLPVGGALNIPNFDASGEKGSRDIVELILKNSSGGRTTLRDERKNVENLVDFLKTTGIGLA